MFPSNPVGKRILCGVLVLLLPLLLLLSGYGLGERASRESLALTQRSIRRAAVQCYALEGTFPTHLDVLKERYGVTIDETLFYVDYQYIASNLMPDITVVPISHTADPEW